MSARPRTVNLYPMSNYGMQGKASQYERDISVPNRLLRLKEEYAKFGMRRSVEAVLLVHEHGMPQVLLLQLVCI